MLFDVILTLGVVVLVVYVIVTVILQSKNRGNESEESEDNQAVPQNSNGKSYWEMKGVVNHNNIIAGTAPEDVSEQQKGDDTRSADIDPAEERLGDEKEVSRKEKTVIDFEHLRKVHAEGVEKAKLRQRIWEEEQAYLPTAIENAKKCIIESCEKDLFSSLGEFLNKELLKRAETGDNTLNLFFKVNQQSANSLYGLRILLSSKDYGNSISTSVYTSLWKKDGRPYSEGVGHNMTLDIQDFRCVIKDCFSLLIDELCKLKLDPRLVYPDIAEYNINSMNYLNSFDRDKENWDILRIEIEIHF